MTIEIPVLDDRSYDQLMAEVRARAAVHTPEWTNLNASDPGITILELFAFLTDNLLYRSNRIPEANRLKFLTMLGIALQPPTPGRALVTVANVKGPLDPLALPAGTEAKAGPVRFATTTGLAVLPVTSQAYYKRPEQLDDATLARYRLIYQTFLESDTDTLSFYSPIRLDEPAAGKPDPVVDLGETLDRSLWLAVLAPGNTDVDDVRRAVAGQSLSIGVYPYGRVAGLTVAPRPGTDPGLVVEIAAPETDPSGLAGPGFGIGAPRYTRLQPTYSEPVLDAPGILQVTLPPYERLLLWAFDPEEEGTSDYPPRLDDAAVSSRLVTWLRLRGNTGTISWAGVNAARAAQTVAIGREALGLGTGTPFQSFTLANAPVVADDEHPFVLEVRDTGDQWQAWAEIDDIFAADPEATAFALDRATGKVTFGSGLAGRRVPRGAAVRVAYSFGGGLAGQVPIGAINRSVALPGGFTIGNPVATWGAGNGETVSDGEAAVTSWLRHRDRLVTAEDFTDLTRRTPGVDLGRVEVLPLFHPDLGPDRASPGTVTVLVVPRTDPLHPSAPAPDRQFLSAVCGWLEPRRLITTELHVCGPVYQPIWVSVGIVTLAGQVPTLIEQAVAAAVRAFLSPLTGGLAGIGWPLGVAVRTRDIEAVATRVLGVRYVDSVVMAAAFAGGALVSPLDTVEITGLQMPDATVFAGSGPAADPASLIGGSQATPPSTVPVPVVPPTC
ncbi:putative baseplate assembly protein [Micromonospora sp. NPDC005806]|uniref:putative baseplate assembly protein n=1 Tax=Micromonospora sp. NPDC005806 TaxID=3364234 RepID=UPI0036967266